MGKTDNYVFGKKNTFYKKYAARGKVVELFDKVTLMDYFVYPGHKHGITGRDRLQLT